MSDRCPTCGSVVRVVQDAQEGTAHYVPASSELEARYDKAFGALLATENERDEARAEAERLRKRMERIADWADPYDGHIAGTLRNAADLGVTGWWDVDAHGQEGGGRMIFELVDPQGQLLAEIADRRQKRADVAVMYAFALRTPDRVEWRVVNQAIIDRWSVSALEWIKTRAWKRFEEGGEA